MKFITVETLKSCVSEVESVLEDIKERAGHANEAIFEAFDNVSDTDLVNLNSFDEAVSAIREITNKIEEFLE